MNLSRETEETLPKETKENHLKRKRPPTVQRAVKRGHLLSALQAIENDVPKKSSRESRHYWVPQENTEVGRLFHLHQTPRVTLLLVLRNAILHHDWSTVALVLELMSNAAYSYKFLYGPIFQVLFNHPESDNETVKRFLSETFNLRSTREQQKFLGNLFHLPVNLDVYKESVDPLFVDKDDDSDDDIEWH